MSAAGARRSGTALRALAWAALLGLVAWVAISYAEGGIVGLMLRIDLPASAKLEALRGFFDELGAAAPVIRVEQLYPWPGDALVAELARYPNLSEVVWLQEEPANMGPWNSVKGHLFEGLGEAIRVQRISRSPEASPATGSHAIHVQEQNQILDAAFAPFT